MSTMSYRVPFVDMSTLTVGSIGKIDLQAILAKVPTDPTEFGSPSHIRMYNDSGSTIEVWADNGIFEDTIPAGAWPTYALEAGTNAIMFRVIHILPNPPIQILSLTIYGPGEQVPDTPSLGNSPVGIGGAVQTSSVQTLSNEGNAKTQLVIDIGDSVLAQLITINNDGTATWKVDVASAAHTILQILSAGNFLKLGQAGDTIEALGKVIVDQLLSAAAGLNITAGGLTVTGGIGTDTLNSSGNVVVGGSMETNTIRDNVTGADQIDLTTSGATVNNLIKTNGGVQLGSLGSDFIASGETGNAKIIDCTSGTSMFINPPASGAGRSIGFATNGVSRGSITDSGIVISANGSFVYRNGNTEHNLSTSIQSATGTVNHNLGETPFDAWITTTVSGSQTVGYDTLTSTTAHCTIFSSLATRAIWRV